MPHASLKLVGGVNQTETPAVNEAGISTSNFIRFLPDVRGLSLPQKLGGWQKWFANTTYSIVRALWAWADTEAITHLGVGCQNASGTYQSQLAVITNGNLIDVTPRTARDNVAPNVSTTLNSSFVVITDNSITGITQFDSVYIPAHIAVGGVILFGLYQCDPDGYLSANSYSIQITDILGNPVLATSGSVGGTVAQFATVNNSSDVTVTLPNHGYSAGDPYPVLIPVTVGGITFFGHYPVISVIDANSFTIIGTQQASATISGFINGGNARFIYGFGIGAIPAGTGFGIGGFGSGGFGTGTAITPSTGHPINANDWTIDNWGEIMIACPIMPQVVLTTTAAAGNGVTGTLTHSETYTVSVGTQIIVAGVTPSSWNGTYTVTAADDTTVSFLTAVTAAQTVAGTITVQDPPFQGIYQWDSESGAPKASVIPQAPPVNDGVFVAMPQRQIIAWGSTFTGIPDPLLVRWCDVNNFGVWTAEIINQAGSYRIPKGSKIVGCIQGPQQGLIWTDIGLWAMQFIGPPFVYSFNQIGFNCGLIGRKAAGTINGEVYWMGPTQFYSLTGNGISPEICPVWDVIFQDLDSDHLDRIRVAVNSRFGEISWFYPTKSSGGEVNAYVKFNTSTNQWDYGALGRSAWIDQSVLGPPIGADPNTLYLYQHETSTDADGQPLDASFQTGWFALSDGDDMIFVDQVFPDMKWGYFDGTQSATVNMTFYGAEYPGAPPRTYGPYSVTENTTFVSPRIRARLMSIAISSDDVGSFWRLGGIRYRIAPDGRF